MIRIKTIYKKKDYLLDSYACLKLINSLQYKFSKNKNRVLYFFILTTLKNMYHVNPLFLFLLAVKNGKNEIVTIKVRIAGKFHNVPVPINPMKQFSRFLKHFRACLKQKKGVSTTFSVIEELTSLINNTKGFLNIANDKLYETGIEELSFIHYRWR